MIICNLKRLLAAQNMSQRALAKQSRVHRRTIGKLYANDWSTINRSILDSLCLALRVTPQELFVWEREDN